MSEHKTSSNDQSYVTLVAQIRVKPGKEEAFSLWLEKVTKALEIFPGFISRNIIPPNLPIQKDWVIMHQFVSTDVAKAWLQSQERQELIKQAIPSLMSETDVYLFDANKKKIQDNIATAVISHLVKPEHEKEFLNWHTQIASVQSKFPGFIGYKLQRPHPGIHDTWVTVLSFDTNEHLENWLKSNERKSLLKEAARFGKSIHIHKIYSGFDFWFTEDKAKRSVIKENMLVLLTLYPVVFLYNKFIQPYTLGTSAPLNIALFIGNTFSTLVLAYITVPFLIKLFSWWLKDSSFKTNILGAAIVISLYILLIYIFSYLS